MASRRQRQVTQQGTAYVTTAAADGNGVATHLVAPTQFGSELTGLSDVFLSYRFTSLTIETFAFELVSAAPISGVVGYTSVLPNTAPASRAEVSQLPHAVMIWAPRTTPTRLTLSSRALQGLQPWFRRSTAFDDNFEFQGALYFAGITATTGTASFFVRYTVEFQDPVPPAMTIHRRIARQEAKQGGSLTPSPVMAPAALILPGNQIPSAIEASQAEAAGYTLIRRPGGNAYSGQPVQRGGHNG